MSPLMWFLVFLIVLIVLFLIYRGLHRGVTAAAAAVMEGNPSQNVGINNVTIAAAPAQVPCDGATKFGITVTAHGWSADGTSRNVNIQLLDDEAFPDPLDHHPKAPATLGMTMGAALPNGLWPWTLNYTNSALYCDAGCNVRGPDGSSSESDPMVYAKLTVVHDTQPWKESARVRLRCGSEGQDDDEESSTGSI